MPSALSVVHAGRDARQFAWLLEVAMRLGHPAGPGIHNKTVLARIDCAGYVYVGGMNASEMAAKTNCDLALQLESSESCAHSGGRVPAGLAGRVAA